MSPRLRIISDPVGEVLFDGEFSDEPGSGYRKNDGTQAEVSRRGMVRVHGSIFEGSRHAISRNPISGEGVNLHYDFGPAQVDLYRERDGAVLRISAEALSSTQNPERR